MGLRCSGVVGRGGALGLVMAMGMFGLYVMQMRELRAEEMRSSVLAGGMFQEVKYFIAAFVLAFLGHGALKTEKTAQLETDGQSDGSPGIFSAPS